jgi:DNA end-binding protein Ku
VTIREAIAATGKVAIGRLVLTTREHMIALEPRGKGLMGTLLRYPYEVREADQFFEEIPDIKIDKEMLELAKHIVATKSAHFEPDKFEDRYEMALREIIKRKAAGETIKPSRPSQEPKVINLMDALRRSLEAEQGEPARPAKKASSSSTKPAKEAASPAAGKRARKSA